MSRAMEFSLSTGLLTTTVISIKDSISQWTVHLHKVETEMLIRCYTDGVFYAELNEFFQRELAEEGYSGVEVRVTPTVTDISMQNLTLPQPPTSYIAQVSDTS